MHLKHWKTILLGVLLWAAMPGQLGAQMDPYFTAINYPVEKDSMMLMLLPDFQTAHQGNNFFTGMVMVQYGITGRWEAGLMAEGQKILGQPVTYGGTRFETYFRLLRSDRLLNVTIRQIREFESGILV